MTQLNLTEVTEVSEKLTREEQVQAFRDTAYVIDRLPPNEMDLFVSDHELSRDKWKLVEIEVGAPDDVFVKKETYLTGVRRVHVVNMLHMGVKTNAFTVTGTVVNPRYLVETTWKTRAEQIKAFDAMRDTMLGALSYLGRSEEARQ